MTDFVEKLSKAICSMINAASGLKAVEVHDTPVFTLADDTPSRYYFDFRILQAYPDIYNDTIDVLIRMVKNEILPSVRSNTGTTRIAGVPMTGLLFSSPDASRLSIPSLYCHPKDRSPVPIQGSLQPGDNVIVLDDLITRAFRKLQTIDSVRDIGARVTHVAVIMDREEGGTDLLRSQGIEVKSLLTATQFAETAKKLGVLSQANAEIITHDSYDSRQRFMREHGL